MRKRHFEAQLQNRQDYNLFLRRVLRHLQSRNGLLNSGKKEQQKSQTKAFLFRYKLVHDFGLDLQIGKYYNITR